MELPDTFDIIVVPDIGPKGKPRACNAWPRGGKR